MTTRDPNPAARTIGVLAVLGALGSAVMSIAHFGVDVPFAPGPGRLLLPVAIGFAVGTALFAAVAFGSFAGTGWAWPAALVVNALAFLSAAMPFRGWVSAVAMVVTAAALVVLLTPEGRRLRAG